MGGGSSAWGGQSRSLLGPQTFSPRLMGGNRPELGKSLQGRAEAEACSELCFVRGVSLGRGSGDERRPASLLWGSAVWEGVRVF